jgi:hypothetical protein
MKVAAGYGLILGFIMILAQLIGYITGIPVLFLCAYTGGVIYTTVIYREKYLNGAISYGKSLLFGILVSGFAFIILGTFVYILISLYPTEYRELFNAVMKDMKTRGLVVPETSEQPVFNPITWIITYLFLGLLVGLIISAITSIFTKKI